MSSNIVKAIVSLQNQPNKIRNVCIVAHVDHGKTTLADCLVSYNGIISSRSAGKLRYLDNTPYEQEKEITVKLSAVALLHRRKRDEIEDYTINLIDSPGHMDFTSEVSSALRMTDGCFVIVDAIEGVCIQTRTVLRQAWVEKVQPVVIINKIDKLITHRMLSPEEANAHLSKVLEQVNQVVGSLWAEDYLQKQATETTTHSDEVIDDDFDDEHVYFSPDKGNVLFASAYHGWGFRYGCTMTQL